MITTGREAEAGFSALGNVRDFRYATETAFSRAAMLGALGDLDRAGRVHIARHDDGQVWVGGASVTCVEGQVLL